MPNSISAPFGALVSNTKVRARNRHRRRHAGHEQGGDLSTIVSAETEAETKVNEEVVPILNCPDDAGLLWEEEDDYESVEQLKCDSGMFAFFCRSTQECSYSFITASNRFALLDCTEPAPGLRSGSTKHVLSPSTKNLPKAADNPAGLDDVQSQHGTLVENSPDYQHTPAAEAARTPSISPPQSEFTFNYARPTSIVTSPTPPTIYSQLVKRKRRRRRSKPTKPPPKEMEVVADPVYDEKPSQNEQAPNDIGAMPSISELTGKEWGASSSTVEVSATEPALAPIDVGSDAAVRLDKEAEIATQLPPKPSYATVAASRSNTSVDATAHTPQLSKTNPPIPRSLQTDPARDWPSSLPPHTGPMLPATKNRRSRFFPRQNPSPNSSHLCVRKPSLTFRHPKSREHAHAANLWYCSFVSKAGLPAAPLSRVPSPETLSSRAASNGQSRQRAASSTAALGRATTESRSPDPAAPKPSPPPKLPRTTPWKWWRGDLSRSRNHSTEPTSPYLPETPDQELMKPKSLEKVAAKEKPNFVTSLEGEWEFVQGVGLRGGWSEEEGEGEGDEGSGVWVWRCGEGCRCMRRGSYA